jgi:hypothetical protein
MILENQSDGLLPAAIVIGSGFSELAYPRQSIVFKDAKK